VDKTLGFGRLQVGGVVSGIPMECSIFVYTGQDLTRWEPPIQQHSDGESKTNSVTTAVFLSYNLIIDVLSYKNNWSRLLIKIQCHIPLDPNLKQHCCENLLQTRAGIEQLLSTCVLRPGFGSRSCTG